jgi:hypothetical protein
VGCQDARCLSHVCFALMPDDGLTRAHNWPHRNGNCYICCLLGSSRSHRLENRTTISAPCITTALLLLCDTDQLFPWVSLRLSHTHTRTQPISWPFLTSKSKPASKARTPHRQHTPHCDASSRPSTLPTEEIFADTYYFCLEPKPCLCPQPALFAPAKTNTQHQPRLTLGHFFTCLC